MYFLMILYLIVCAFNLGLVNLAPLFEIATPFGRLNAEDITSVLLLVLTFPAYLRQRRLLASRMFQWLEVSWLVLIVFLAFQSYRSAADSLQETMVNMRFVQSYLLFFSSIAVINSRKRLRLFAVMGVMFAVIGTTMTIAQSQYGLSDMFESSFYDIGAWGGNKTYVAGVVRVNLPISDWIAFALLVLFMLLVFQMKFSYLLLVGYLMVAIFLNFARSLWLAMILAGMFQIVLLTQLRVLSTRRLLQFMTVPIALLISVLIAAYAGFGGLIDALSYRVFEGIYYYSADTGTWAGRIDAQQAAIQVWEGSPWLGVGTNYYNAFGSFLDLGFAITLLSVGVLGFMLLVYFLVLCVIAGYSAAKRGVAEGSLTAVVIGTSLCAEVVLILVYQQWMTPRCFAILGIASALALAPPRLYQRPVQQTLGQVQDSGHPSLSQRKGLLITR